MDERVLQLKELKKEYKKARRKAGCGFRVLAWIFGALSGILWAMTGFVLLNHTAPVAFVDNRIWEPLKALVPFGINYAAGWRLTEQWGLIAAAAGLGITGVLLLLGFAASEKAKKTEAYLNYRTLKLTLDTEKEERRQ